MVLFQQNKIKKSLLYIFKAYAIRKQLNTVFELKELLEDIKAIQQEIGRKEFIKHARLAIRN